MSQCCLWRHLWKRWEHAANAYTHGYTLYHIRPWQHHRWHNLTHIFSSQIALPSPFPFSLPLHSLTYITRQQSSIAASRLATRPGDVRSATLFLERGPPKNTYGGPFHTPAQIHTAGGSPFPIPQTHWPSEAQNYKMGNWPQRGPNGGCNLHPPFWAHGQVTQRGPILGGAIF